MAVRVLLVGDDPVALAGLRTIMSESDTIDIVGVTPLGDPAGVEHMLNSAPDVVLMSNQLTDGVRYETIQAITSNRNRGSQPPKFFMISMNPDDHAVVAALRAGVRGYMVRISSPDVLVHCIEVVADGGAVFCPHIASRLSTYFSAVHDLPGRVAFPELTNREREILDLIARGHNNRQIARNLVIAEKTVRNHITNIFVILQIGDRAAAVVRARDAGLGT